MSVLWLLEWHICIYLLNNGPAFTAQLTVNNDPFNWDDYLPVRCRCQLVYKKMLVFRANYHWCQVVGTQLRCPFFTMPRLTNSTVSSFRIEMKERPNQRIREVLLTVLEWDIYLYKWICSSRTCAICAPNWFT